MTFSYYLSEGALQVIMNDGEYLLPIVHQVLAMKKINSGMTNNNERYRMILSDGKNSTSFAMWSVSSIKDATCANGIPMFSVIKINKHIRCTISNAQKEETSVLLILDLRVIVPGDEVGFRIGLPIPMPLTGFGPIGLSEGALKVIMGSGEYLYPIVQVLGMKKINLGTVDRYRMLLSDGKNTISFVMLSIEDATCGNDGIPNFSVLSK